MQRTAEAPVLTLDGPSGTGKGTVGRLVATRLRWHYLDSGAIYRVFAYMANDSGISPHDIGRLSEFSRTLTICFEPDPNASGVQCNGVELSEVIRTEHCGDLASRYAAQSQVRSVLLDLQRAQRQPPGLVADGRDMGSTVFPDAQVKIYLDAGAEVRVQRRYKQLKEKGFDGSLAHLRQEMAERDERDASRATSPLVVAADAFRIDTSDMTIEAVVETVIAFVTARIPDTRIAP